MTPLLSVILLIVILLIVILLNVVAAFFLFSSQFRQMKKNKLKVAPRYLDQGILTEGGGSVQLTSSLR